MESKGIWYFEDVNLFEHFCPVTNAGEMYHKFPKKVYQKSEYIYFPEDNADSVFFIDSGAVKIGTLTPDGNEMILAVLQPGEVFGELAITGSEMRNEFAQAVEDTSICIMDAEEATKLMRDATGFYQFFKRLIGERIIYTQRRMQSLLFKDAKTRIAEYILDEAEKHGRHKKGQVTLRNYLTHQEIANFTGTSRQTVTTVLNEFREKGLIDFDRRNIIIKDIEKMEPKYFVV